MGQVDSYGEAALSAQLRFGPAASARRGCGGRNYCGLRDGCDGGGEATADSPSTALAAERSHAGVSSIAALGRPAAASSSLL